MSYLTVEELKDYGGVDGSGDDALLTQLIARAESDIEADRGYSFKVESDTTRYFTVGDATDGNKLYFDMWLAAITSVVTNADADSPTTLTSSEYVTQPRNDTPYFGLKILSSSSNSWEYTSDAEAGIEVTGRWGWSTVPPENIKHACARLASYYYKQKDAGVFDTTAIPDAGIIQAPQGIPRDVMMILEKYPKGFG